MTDAYTLWEAHDREQERRLARCPVCSECGEHIQDLYFYEINDEPICIDCMDGYKKYVEDVVE